VSESLQVKPDVPLLRKMWKKNLKYEMEKELTETFKDGKVHTPELAGKLAKAFLQGEDVVIKYDDPVMVHDEVDGDNTHHTLFYVTVQEIKKSVHPFPYEIFTITPLAGRRRLGVQESSGIATFHHRATTGYFDRSVAIAVLVALVALCLSPLLLPCGLINDCLRR